MAEPLIRCEQLTKKYGMVQALKGISFEAAPGRIVGLLGPNGSGKTTLIKLMCGLIQPSSGSVQIAGEAPGPYTKALVSYLPDCMYYAEWMKGKDLLDFFSDFYADFDRTRAERMCESLDLDLSRRVKALSKGTREKLQLIVVMSRRARLYLLDEPIAGVDPAARDYILDTILRNRNPEGTVLISTHLIADVEPVLDDVIFLQEGRIVLQDTAEHLRSAGGMSIDAFFREKFRAKAYVVPPDLRTQAAAPAYQTPPAAPQPPQTSEVSSPTEGGGRDVQ